MLIYDLIVKRTNVTRFLIRHAAEEKAHARARAAPASCLRLGLVRDDRLILGFCALPTEYFRRAWLSIISDGSIIVMEKIVFVAIMMGTMWALATLWSLRG